MNTHRLIDWLKLCPMLLAAAVLAGCDSGGEGEAPADMPIGAEISTPDETPVEVEEAEVTVVEPEPAPAEPEPAPAEEPATP